jgi:ABC-2 type transport system permease protein
MIKQLFYKRLYAEWKDKYQAILSIIDWTIIIYIIMPAMIFSGLYYKSWWEEFPAWIYNVPSFVLFFVLYTLAVRGEVRSFLEAGDQLFLIQYPHYVKEIVGRGIVYTFLRMMLSSIVIIGILLPFLVHWLQLGAMQIAWLYSFFTLFRFTFSFFNRFLRCSKPSWWKKLLISTAVRIISTAVFISGCIVGAKYGLAGAGYLLFLSAIIFLFIKRKLHNRHHFATEVQRENDCRMRWTRMILVRGMIISKPSTRSQSIFFPMSKKLFRQDTLKNRIAESYIKTYFRKNDNRTVYIQLVLASCVALIFTPVGIKILVVIFMVFALFQLAKAEWNVFQEGMFMKLYCEEGDRLFIASQVKGYIVFPAVMIVGSVIVGMFSALFGVVAMILSIIILFDYVL